MALFINWKIGLVFLLVTPLIALVLYAIMSRSLPFYSRIQAGQDTISRLAGENLAGVRVIRAFDRQISEVESFETAGNDLATLTVRVGKLSALLSPITTVLMNLGVVAIVWKGAQYANVGVLEQGQIIALVSYMTQALLAMIVLANLIVIFTKAIASAKRVAQVLELEPSIVDAAQPVQSDVAEAAAPDTPRIAFEDVSFAYPGAGEPAVEHISFDVQAGQTLGIIGGTGCGKTTIVRLITRDYDVTSGAVRMDGTDVRNVPLLALRARIGTVFQAARLFSGTVRSNLLMANENATDAQLWKALETAQGAEFVRAKPDGLDTRVEEGGKNLSGGQKQRLTIARALVRQPEVLILDDAASALDYATDAALRRALRTDTNGMTVVMISQRASTIRYADCILVLDDGVQCGFGTHDELLKTCAVYKEICKSQGLLEGGDAQ
jgi:ATP-binding cassette subfamily B protein